MGGTEATSPFIRPRGAPPPAKRARTTISKVCANMDGIVASTTSVDTANDKATTSSTAGVSREKDNSPTPPTLPKSPTPTPPTGVNAHRLRVFLKGYNRALIDKLYNGFTHGFLIPSSYANSTPSSYTNHTSALIHAPAVVAKINKELLLGRIAGPFTSPPLPGLIISPLGLVPKKSSTEWRLIHDLSFP